MLKKIRFSTFLILISSSILLLSCTTNIHYLGDTRTPTSVVDLYYDVKEVKKPYQVIGRMTNSQFLRFDIDKIKSEMIKKAKQIGADGLIFSDLSMGNTPAQEGGVSVKAEAIKYQ